MSVVDGMRLLKDAPIYTVHDNFITNAHYSLYLKNFYIETIQEMGPPLLIINEFIIHNLFLPVIKENQKHEYDINSDDYIPRVFSAKTLDDFLYLNIPDNFKDDKRRLKVWNTNVSRLKDYYAKNVCGEKKRWDDHVKKWTQFEMKLSGNYCIHL